MLSSCERWMLNDRKRGSVDVRITRCLKSIYGVGKVDMVRNEIIR